LTSFFGWFSKRFSQAKNYQYGQVADLPFVGFSNFPLNQLPATTLVFHWALGKSNV